MGSYLAFSRCAQCNCRGLPGREAGGSESEEEMWKQRRTGRCHTAGSEDGGSATSQRMWAPLGAGRGEERGSPQTLQGISPTNTLVLAQ